MTIQFLTDSKGHRKSVVLKYSDYQKLLEKAGELAIIKAYDTARAKKQKFSAAYKRPGHELSNSDIQAS